MTRFELESNGHVNEEVRARRSGSDAPTRLTDERLQEVINLYLEVTPESPYIRLGFHIVASYDRVARQEGGTRFLQEQHLCAKRVLWTTSLLFIGMCWRPTTNPRQPFRT